MALLRLLVQPCVVTALGASGGHAAVICSVANALQCGKAVPTDDLRTTCALFNTNPCVLPLELRQLAVMTVRDAATHASVPSAERAEALNTALAHARRLPHPIPPDLRVVAGPSDGPDVASLPGRVRVGVQPITRASVRPGRTVRAASDRGGDARRGPDRKGGTPVRGSVPSVDSSVSVNIAQHCAHSLIQCDSFLSLDTVIVHVAHAIR